MNYAFLRREGIRHLGRLAGEQWTDFNTHDPGITILEQLCYAITDLGYRTTHPMPDLLAGSAEPGFPAPSEILTADPVTRADLRKLVLDVEGIENAWVEMPDEPELAFFHHAHSRSLRLQPDLAEIEAGPVGLRGLHRVLLQTSDQLSGTAALEQVAAAIHSTRLLGEDFEIERAGRFAVQVNARLEVGPVEDPNALMADLIEAIQSHLAPPARFVSLADALAEGRTLDQLFEGPPLAHGFFVALPEPRRTVYVSDLVRAIMDVESIRAVRSLELPGASNAGRDGWALPVPQGQIAMLASDSELTFERGGLPVYNDPEAVTAQLEQRRRDRAQRFVDERKLAAPIGRDRRLASYRSLQRQLPAAYGVGPLGLGAAPSRRRAQALELEAYLLIFDQLLANAFAQLAHAHELLSPGEGGIRTYFAQVVGDLDVTQRLVGESEAHQAWLHEWVERWDSPDRRKRFLAHLLARVAEQLDDAALVGIADAAESDQAIIAIRQAFLRHYPALSRARGSGHDILGEADPYSELEAESTATRGFAQRIALKLGLRERPRFHVVEHLLLRPVTEDIGQLTGETDPEVPLLAGVTRADPFSQQVSFVFESLPEFEAHFEDHVALTIQAETPAQVTPYLLWFGGDDWTAFDEAWRKFCELHREYRWSKLRDVDVNEDFLQLRFRDARDRVIDLLGYRVIDPRGDRVIDLLGRTYPLRDLPLPEHVIVNPGTPASIPLAFSQRGVDYALRDPESGDAIKIDGEAVIVPGTGDTIGVPTPAILDDVIYRILAVKQVGADVLEQRRETWLRWSVRVEEGVDPTLDAQIDAPLLDKSIDDPKPSDARIVDHGAEVEIEVLNSQEGVTYVLIDQANHGDVLSQEPVVGTSGTIRLRYGPVDEDVDLRVRGTKQVGDPDNPVERTAVLDIVLLLRVRANSTLSAKLAASIVAYGGDTKLEVPHSQASAKYQVWRRRIRDRELVFDVDPEPKFGIVDVAIDDQRVARVARPFAPGVWPETSAFEVVGEAQRGTGEALEFPLGVAVEDSLWLVQASKQHRTGPLDSASAMIPSAVQLDQALALLVRPDHGRIIGVQTTIVNGATEGPLLVSGGQPGVYYELRVDDEPVTLPAYLHQRDDANPAENKGIDQIRVEIDLVVTRDGLEVGQPATTPPLIPALDTFDSAGLPVGTVMEVTARKAMTGLEVPLDRSATIEPIPTIRAEPASVAPGAAALILVEPSVPGERYSLWRAGALVGAPVTGNGNALEFDTGALTERTAFEVAVEAAPDPGALPVERRVQVVIDIEQD